VGSPSSTPTNLLFLLWIVIRAGISSRKSSLSDRPIAIGRAYWIERTASYHHPVPQKAVRKVGTAEVLSDGPYLWGVIALYPPHVVGVKRRRRPL
jgi:hypothetical protein